MIQMINVHTTELDDSEDAVAEILEQLDFSKLKTNTVGFVSCYYEFADNGTVAALSEQLPFDFVGMTTTAGACFGDNDVYRLNLTILTSDDVSFTTMLSKPLYLADYDSSIKETYDDAAAKLSKPPSLILVFFPVTNDISGYKLLKSLDTAAGGVPIFGSISSDVSMDMENSKVMRNDVSDARSAAGILFEGPVDARFVTESITSRDVLMRQAVVTDSDDCLIKKINDVSTAEYFRDLGIIIDVGINASSLPLLIRYAGASTSVALGVYQWNEDDSALCAGPVPVGTSIALGDLDRESILTTADAALDRIKQDIGENSSVIMFPCVTRYMLLSPDSFEEIDYVNAKMDANIPFVLSYSGGEICPIIDDAGKLSNQLHNYTFTACILS